VGHRITRHRTVDLDPIFYLHNGSLNRCRLSTAAYSYAEETISSPLSGVGRFEPLGSTPLRDSRYTFRISAAWLGIGRSGFSPNSPDSSIPISRESSKLFRGVASNLRGYLRN
jgi:hypothetical protein